MDIVVILALAVVALVLLAACMTLFRQKEQTAGQYNDMNNRLVASETEKKRLAESLKDSENKLADAKNESDKKIASLNEKLMALTAENSRLQERIDVISGEKERIRRENEAQFKELASKILDDKTQKSDLRLNEILKPLRDEIERLNKDIIDRAEKDIKNHASLSEQIRMLASLNQQISSDANNLAQALKGNSKMQGDWGEMILEQILSSSGLIKGEQFDVQVTKDASGNIISNEEGRRLQPDVIVHFPDKKDIIIDSKVSIKDYADYVNSSDKDEQDRALANHILSVKKHIDELARKKYQDYLSTAGDFVMMFIPNEGAYLCAMQADNKLWEYAYEKRVVIISPTHLISVLKLVSQLWSHDKQTKNAIEIADAAGRLYDKFVGFLGDMNEIEKSINNASKSYGNAMKKLSTGTGNLIKRVETLKELGAKATKQIQIGQADED